MKLIKLTLIELTKSIDDATTHVTEQEDWLKKYFSKRKSGRKSMFYERRITVCISIAQAGTS